MARQLFQRFVSFFRTPTGPVLDAYFGSGPGGTKRTARYEVNEKDGGQTTFFHLEMILFDHWLILSSWLYWNAEFRMQ